MPANIEKLWQQSTDSYLITALYNKRNNCLSTNVVVQETKKINNGFNGSQSNLT